MIPQFCFEVKEVHDKTKRKEAMNYTRCRTIIFVALSLTCSQEKKKT
jgi:hypothetical protein